MKHVLITAGCTYGRLDDNKLVGNRIRGIWATKFACWLFSRGYNVTLLLPDTFDKTSLEKGLQDTNNVYARVYGRWIENEKRRETPAETASRFARHLIGEEEVTFPTFEVIYQNGYESYAEQCYALAPQVDAAVMASAVVNWIPQSPIKGKMKTEGYEEGDVINIPFYLAPRVIDRMKKLNPKLTLIGCKMTSGASREDLLKAAYHTLLKGHCNVVVANDLSDLKIKTLVYPDGRQKITESFEAMYSELKSVIDDKFYRTESDLSLPVMDAEKYEAAKALFDHVCTCYRSRFMKRPDGQDRVFGSVAVRIDDRNVLVSPREKGTLFSSKDAVVVTGVDRVKHVVKTCGGQKATLNAPLLLSVLAKYGEVAVVHLHEEPKHFVTLPYAPPGSVRDNDREIPDLDIPFNLEGHGCVFALAP